MRSTMQARIVAAFLALLTWAVLALRLYLTVADAIAKGLDLAAVLVGFCSFFTILSNLLVACVCTWIAFAPDRSNATLEAATAVYIAVVGIGYSVLLRHLWDLHGLEKVSDVLLHDLVPLFYVLFWLFFRCKRRTLPWSFAFLWLIWPAVYLVYSMIRGSMTGLYPYPFLNPGQLGYSHVLFMVAALVVAFFVLGLAAIALTRRGSLNPSPASSFNTTQKKVETEVSTERNKSNR